MLSLNWSNEYSVGVQELDNQHHKLMDLINRLSALYEQNRFAHVDVAPIFKDVMDYADMHFSTEEHYFQLYNYPKKEGHIAMHEAYRKTMEKLKQEYDAENSAKTLFAINNTLNEWWNWHINNVDKEYTEYFHANGLK